MRKVAFLSSVAIIVAAPAFGDIDFSIVPGFQSANPGDQVSIDVVVSGLELTNPDEVVRDFRFDLAYDTAYLAPQSITFGGFLGNGDLFDPFEPSIRNLTLDWAAEFGFWSTCWNDPAGCNPLVGWVQSDFAPPQEALPGNLDGHIAFGENSLICYDSAEAFGNPICAGPPFLDQKQPDSFLLASIQFGVLAGVVQGSSTLVQLADDRFLSSVTNPSYDPFPTLGILDAKGIAPQPLRGTSVGDGTIAIAGVPEPQPLALVALGGVLLGLVRRRRKGSC